MIKKMIAVALAAWALCLVGCGVVNENVQETSVSPAELKDVKVKNDSGAVVITVPGDFLGTGMTQEDYDAMAKEKGYASIVLNADGSATYSMTEAQHDEMMQGLAESIKKTLKEMAASDDYPDVESIIANDDFTAFEVSIDADEVGIDDSVLVLPLYTYGGMYNIFNGTQTPGIKVRFFNSKTGMLISEADSSNIGQQ